MNLAAMVKSYLEHAGGFDRPLHLSQLGLSKSEVERLFSRWDEDYQISRFVLLSRQGGLTQYPESLRVFLINGYEYTHVTFRAGIKEFLGLN